MLPSDYLCHMWKPEYDPNFFGGRKHMSTMIGLSILWAILGSRVTAAISPTSLCLYVAEQVPRAWLFLLLQPHPNQALPASPTSHTELLLITRACSCCSFWREYLLFISISARHMGTSCSWNNEWLRRPFLSGQVLLLSLREKQLLLRDWLLSFARTEHLP